MHATALTETALTIDPDSLGEGSFVAQKTGSTPRKTAETLGERVSRLRKERGITQVELAEKLGVVQPVVSDYERGELRLHGQLIVELTKILRVSADELLGLQEPKSNATVKNRRLLRRIQELEHLPKRDQQAVLRTIDAFLSKAS